jgi:sugar lactone lactonase YvrE
MKQYVLLALMVSLFTLSKGQTITMDTFSGSLCAGEKFWVHMSSTGTFPTGNYFVVECSDSHGHYYGTWLSSPTYGSPDSIYCTVFPQYFPQTDSGYRIRVINTGTFSNADSSNDNGTPLTIYAIPPAPMLVVSGHGCIGTDSITALGAGGAPVMWQLGGYDTTFFSADSTFFPQSPGTYVASYITSAAYGQCPSAVSDSAVVHPTQASVMIGYNTNACFGQPITYTASAVNGDTMPAFQWYVDGTAVGTDSFAYVNNTALSTDSITVVLTSSSACVTGTRSATIPSATFAIPPVDVLAPTGHACLGADSLLLHVTSPYNINWYNGSTLLDSLTAVYTAAGGNGQGFNANQLSVPFSVYLDNTGALYVADAFNARVQKFPPGSTSLSDAVTVAANGIGSPVGIFVDAQGYLYVSDDVGNVVWKFPPGSDANTAGIVIAGNPNTTNYSAPNAFYAAISIYLDAAGNLYVGDDGNDRIQKFAPGSDSLTPGITVAKSGIAGISAIWLDGSGRIYVSDYNKGQVMRFPAGGDSTTAGTVIARKGLIDPTGVSVDASGALYVADGSEDLVWRYAPGSDSTTQGQVVASGGPGTGPYQLSDPLYIFLGPQGDIYVSDAGNSRVQRWTSIDYDTIRVPAGTGSYTVTYISVNGCQSAVTDTVVVTTPPQVSLSLDSSVQQGYLLSNPSDTFICFLTSPYVFPLSGGSPAGGTYSGTFISHDTISLTDANIYRVDTIAYTYTTAAGCSATATDTFVTVMCDGIHDLQVQNTLSLYPNPNTGSFILETTDATGQLYTITDMLGRIVAQDTIRSGPQAVSVAGITTGSYVLHISGGGNAIPFTVEK